MTQQNDCGVQPLDEVLNTRGLSNDDLVKKSSEQLTYKQVQKGRKGRRLSANIKAKIINALNACVEEGKYSRKDLFNY